MLLRERDREKGKKEEEEKRRESYSLCKEPVEDISPSPVSVTGADKSGVCSFLTV